MKDRGKFLAAIRQMAAVFGRPCSDDLLDGYWRALEDLDDAAFQRAVTDCLRKSKFMPSPLDLREIAGAAGGFKPSEYPEFE